MKALVIYKPPLKSVRLGRTVKSRIIGIKEMKKTEGIATIEDREILCLILNKVKKITQPRTKRIGETKSAYPAKAATHLPPWK